MTSETQHLHRNYRQCLQIAIPNISKYLVNGHKSTQQAIQTLFQSVQLNINNPNFLIMQGRITKVRSLILNAGFLHLFMGLGVPRLWHQERGITTTDRTVLTLSLNRS